MPVELVGVKNLSVGVDDDFESESDMVKGAIKNLEGDKKDGE